jgi:hypothetical protein
MGRSYGWTDFDAIVLSGPRCRVRRSGTTNKDTRAVMNFCTGIKCGPRAGRSRRRPGAGPRPAAPPPADAPGVAVQPRRRRDGTQQKAPGRHDQQHGDRRTDRTGLRPDSLAEGASGGGTPAPGWFGFDAAVRLNFCRPPSGIVKAAALGF